MINYIEFCRAYWDFAFENPDMVTPTHAAIYLFAVEHSNRMGGKQKIGLPTSMVLDAIGSKSYNTYKKHFEDLVEWGFFILHQKSKNQHSSNVISLSSAVSKNNKALDKALTKHCIKQSESTIQSTSESTGSIISNLINTSNSNILDTKKNITIPRFASPTVEEVKLFFAEKGYREDKALLAFEYYDSAGWKDSKGKQVKNWKQKMIAVWFKDENKIQAALTYRSTPTQNYQPTERDRQ